MFQSYFSFNYSKNENYNMTMENNKNVSCGTRT